MITITIDSDVLTILIGLLLLLLAASFFGGAYQQSKVREDDMLPAFPAVLYVLGTVVGVITLLVGFGSLIAASVSVQ